MKNRYPIAVAFAAALAGLVTFTAKHEGTGPGVVRETGDRAPETEAALAAIRAQQAAITYAYPDPGYGWKVPTLCHGHTRGVKKGDTATLAQCEQWLIEDYEAIVLPALVRCVTAPVTENEAAALADFVFNVGGTRFCASTLVKKLNAQDYAGAAAEFPRWVYSNGKKLPGLVKRRADERALFEREAA